MDTEYELALILMDRKHHEGPPVILGAHESQVVNGVLLQASLVDVKIHTGSLVVPWSLSAYLGEIHLAAGKTLTFTPCPIK